MAEKLALYECEVCGNIVEVLHSGKGELVCCGKPMNLIPEKSREDEGKEKHVPVIEKTEKGIKVKVGSVPHPMESNHYIEWIEVVSDERICRKYINFGDAPEVEFETANENAKAREYCTIHGLWKN